jgi:predicted Rossmann fold flavoprotein
MPADYDIAIVGAGAAGLAAAIFAAEAHEELSVALLDGARTLGAKILVSGGGRCNITNASVSPSDFHASAPLVLRILQRFDERAAVRWFESLGVTLKEEPSGKIFPTTNKARTVLTALLHRCQELGIHLLTNHRVQSMTHTDTGFLIRTAPGDIKARQVIMATGGKSLPKSGSDGQGWSMAVAFGHSVSPAHPALVPLVLADTFIHAGLSGISHEASIITRVNGKIVDRRVGSLLWTHFGISGPVVLDASRFWVMAKEQRRDVMVSISCLPEKNSKEVDHWLTLASQQSGRKTVASLLGQHLPARLVEALCELAARRNLESSPQEDNVVLAQTLASTPLNQLPHLARKALTQTLTDLPIPVIGHRGWNFAEVTSGGIPLSEINPRSMMSRIVPGLYLIGEMLDCDGRIGGFNFQWAWSTGFIAGTSAANKLPRPKES